MTQVPAGYVGKLLTPSGWDSALLPPGQVNIGAGSCTGKQSKLVLLEATTITILETFRDAVASTDKVDHRIITKDGVPTSVDMYVRVNVPDDATSRNNIFALMTPTGAAGSNVYTITLQNIYARFVEMDVRNRVRDIICSQPNFQGVLSNYDAVNKQVAAAVIQAFKDDHVPLILQDAQLSQVLPDPQVWDSEVKLKAAEAQIQAIEKIGDAMANTPGYQNFLKWQTLQNIAQTGNLIVITDGNSDSTPGIVINPITPTTGNQTAKK